MLPFVTVVFLWWNQRAGILLWFGRLHVKRHWCICGESIPLFSCFRSSHEDQFSAHLNSVIYWLVCSQILYRKRITGTRNSSAISWLACWWAVTAVWQIWHHFCLSVRCYLMFLIILVWVRFSMSLVQEPIRHVLGVKFKISIACSIIWYKKFYLILNAAN